MPRLSSIILRLTPSPLEKSLLPLIPSYLVYLLDFFLRESFKESSESFDSELVSSLHKLGDSSSSTASLALRFPRAWVRNRSINSALLPLVLTLFWFRYIFSSLIFFFTLRVNFILFFIYLFLIDKKKVNYKYLFF